MTDQRKHYAERDIMEMDRAGNYYCRHVSAMTGEGLHSKSDIAAELGFRDQRIDALQALNAELLEALEECHGALEWAIEQGGGPDCEHEAGVCFCKERNALSSASDAIAKARSQS